MVIKFKRAVLNVKPKRKRKQTKRGLPPGLPTDPPYPPVPPDYNQPTPPSKDNPYIA